MPGLKPLTPDRAAEARAFCLRTPAASVPVLAWLAEGGLAGAGPPPGGRGWLFAEDDPSGEIRALALISEIGVLHPVGRSMGLIDGVAALARANPGLVRVLVGPRPEVDALWERLQSLGLRARSIRIQRLLSVERSRFVSSHGALRLETATHRNLLELVESSAAMSREESGEDPQRRNPLLFRERIASRLARRHDFVLHEGSELVFKCNVSALSEFGGQIEGVYCSPDFRRRGHGTAGTSWITEWVLGRAPRAVLLVNDANLIAKRMYAKLGYEDLYASRTIFVGPRGGGPSAD